MLIEGHRLMAPQGSNGFSWPNPAKVWKEVGLPTDLDALQWERKARNPDDSYESMPESSDEADTGGPDGLIGG